MKTFKPISLVPIREKPDDSPEILELKREFNQKLKEISRASNAALQSITGNLLDMGLWVHGELVTITGSDAADGDQDFPVRHHLGAVPQYWIQLRQTWFSPKEANTSATRLIEGVTTWTDKYAYFRVPDTAFSAITGCTYKVLLIP